MTKNSELQQKKILIVEDVELNQYLARHIMESWGCVVEVAENGRLAVEKVKMNEYDLVLMDIQMPEMDGMEATKAIRSMNDKMKSTIPIVALTANAQKAECEEYMRIGMNDYLAKPYEEPALYKMITKNLKKEGDVSASSANAAPEKATAQEAANEKLYDLSMVEAISGGDQTFIQRMLSLFLETVPGTLKDLNASADSGEWLQMSKHAHKLKSTIDSMGISPLKQEIRLVESGGKNGGDPGELRAKVKHVNKVMKEVMDKVRADWKL